MTREKESETVKKRKKLLAKLKKKKPNFRRQNYRYYRALRGKWRKPRGLHNKLKRNHRDKGSVPNIGYKNPSIIRGLHPSGYEEVLVHTPSEVKDVDPEAEAIKVGSSVGKRKKIAILNKADEKNIKVLNR